MSQKPPQKPPVKRSPMLIFLVILFNLIWIALLFLSCQADGNSASGETFEMGVESSTIWMMDRAYSVPLYKPPSTCSITPVI